MVAGIGCRTGVGGAEVLAAVDAALDAHGLGREMLSALATLATRRGEPALAEAAEALGVPLHTPDDTALDEVRPRLVTHSAHSVAATGFGSAAEAAALAVAGPDARLAGPRLTTGPVTCAIAAAGDKA